MQLGSVIRSGLHLAQFAPYHFVAGFVVAGNIDLVDVYLAARLYMQHEIHGFGLGIRYRLHVDFAERIACAAHTVLHRFKRLHHLLAFVPFAFLHGQHFVQLFFRHFAGVAIDGYLAPTVTFALIHRNFDGLFGFVFVGLNVGIHDAEAEIAVVLIKLADMLQVLREFLLVELVAFGQPRPHTALAQRHLFHQLAVGINVVAFKFDVGDFGRFALIDGYIDGNAVTRQFFDGRGNFNRLFAAADIFVAQGDNRLIQGRLIEILRLRQPERFQIFLDGVVLQHFRAGDVQRGDGRAFDHGQQHLVAHRLHAHIVEEAGGVQVFNDFFAACVAEIVAYFDGQIVEHRTWFGTLQTFDADILDDKVRHRQRRQAQYHQS